MKCPRQHCGGNTFLKHNGKEWVEQCLLCDREFPVKVEGATNELIMRCSDIPASNASPMLVRYKPAKVYSHKEE